jgi:hypothetical protein
MLKFNLIKTFGEMKCGENLKETFKIQRRYVTNRKFAGSRPDKVNAFLSIYLILPAALVPGVYSASNINEYQKHKNNVSGE